MPPAIDSIAEADENDGDEKPSALPFVLNFRLQ